MFGFAIVSDAVRFHRPLTMGETLWHEPTSTTTPQIRFSPIRGYLYPLLGWAMFLGAGVISFIETATEVGGELVLVVLGMTFGGGHSARPTRSPLSAFC